jgi:sulfur carrier protein
MYLNMKITINGNIREFSYESMTADELVVELKLTGKRFAIERNGEIMPKSLFKQFTINDGDSLEIVGAVGGG